ncbi:MAG: glutamate 5-kinase [Kiritimatiellae bacterium]|nr:glutamate 5-kinase [Kiritimatiellia bacterium]
MTTRSSPSCSLRAPLAKARRIVVKLGSRVLVRADGRPDRARMAALVRDIAQLQRSGREMIVVSSGAIASGMEAMGWRTRPKSLPELQMAAAIGQVRLMKLYDELFRKSQCLTGQMLLTHDGLRDRERHLSARQTLHALMRHRVIPVINENDTVAVDEIKFGDNDQLAALVALLADADALILMSTVDGLRAPAGRGRTRRVPVLRSVTRRELELVFGARDEFSSGGMASKLQSAHAAARAGIPVVIAHGRTTGILEKILSGADVGTLIGEPGSRPRWSARREWIGFFHHPQGVISVDEGARRALVERGTSLLAIGVTGVRGTFAAESVVDIADRNGHVIARGWTCYSADDIRKVKGLRTARQTEVLGARDYDEIVHRDHMIVLATSEATA